MMASRYLGRLLMLGVGAMFGGLFFVFRDLIPYLAAKRSGVITRRGYSAIKVSRDQEPERFANLLASRAKGVAFGFALSGGGLVAVVVAVFGMIAASR